MFFVFFAVTTQTLLRAIHNNYIVTIAINITIAKAAFTPMYDITLLLGYAKHVRRTLH